MTWPLVRTHAGSRRKLLYLGSHATQPQFVCRHGRSPDDLVMWDNRAVLHRGRRYDGTQRRDMRRSAVEDRL